MGHTGKHSVKSETTVYIRGRCKQRKRKKEKGKAGGSEIEVVTGAITGAE